MWPALIGAGISAGASLLGGWLNNKSDKEAGQNNAKLQMQMANKNIALQKEFAKSGIQWKVHDAKKAGVHPLYALGAQTTSFSPVSVGSPYSSSGSFGNALASAGQDIGRAVQSTQSTLTQHQMQYNALQLENMRLQNEALQTQIDGSKLATLRQVGSSPGIPSAEERFLIPGQNSSGVVTTKPFELTATNPGSPHMEPAAISDVGLGLTASGGYTPVPSAVMKQRIEDDFIGELMWNFRNRVGPALGLNKTLPPIDAGEGKIWAYDPLQDAYVPKKKGPALIKDWVYWY